MNYNFLLLLSASFADILKSTDESSNKFFKIVYEFLHILDIFK